MDNRKNETVLEYLTNNQAHKQTNRKETSLCLTCCSSLYEKSSLSSHRTLFKHLHHSSMSSCSHWLLVHFQDQVSLYQPWRSLGAWLQHLHRKNTPTITQSDSLWFDFVVPSNYHINTKPLLSTIINTIGLDLIPEYELFLYQGNLVHAFPLILQKKISKPVESPIVGP